jgi:hypothetical protein
MAAADEIEARLRALGTPERAQGEKRYLKSSLDFLGVRVPDVRREVRAVARMIDSHDELVSLVEDLWSAPVHERRLAAALLLDTRADLLGPDDLVLIERLVRESKTWALVDVLAGTVLGTILLAHPEAADDLDRWAGDDDFWIRRSALLSQGKPPEGRCAVRPLRPLRRLDARREGVLHPQGDRLGAARRVEDPPGRGVRLAPAPRIASFRGHDARGR